MAAAIFHLAGPWTVVVLRSLLLSTVLGGSRALATATLSSAAAVTSSSAASTDASTLPASTALAPAAKKVMYYDGKTLAWVEYGDDGVTLQTCRLFELE